ncbi:phosphonopyruvate decarboxylase [Gammaproteobacteria bacterium]|nr:phosphonopyruvate decarboxylase [Gammaproteobacteria bacterium]
MIEPSSFYNELKKEEIDFFVGVPDSLLKNFCSFVDDNIEKDNHIIAANEGNAISIASGYHLATKKIPVVYMQNSGLGNCINPLTSLADKEVYSIPMLLIIGWRGEPGKKDEPQHLKQGRITREQLKILDIDYFVIDENTDEKSCLEKVIKRINKNSSPVAILVRENTFKKYKLKNKQKTIYKLKREEAIKEIINLSNDSDIFISTTGKTSRELYEIRKNKGDAQKDFLTVGSMGHASSIALGVAIGLKKQRVICLDGDGSLIMHLGSLPIIGAISPKNLVHVILNNCAHESVGGQPTVANEIDFEKLSSALNYKNFFQSSNVKQINDCWSQLIDSEGPSLFLINIKSSSRKDLGRPESSPIENKESFMEFIKNDTY